MAQKKVPDWVWNLAEEYAYAKGLSESSIITYKEAIWSFAKYLGGSEGRFWRATEEDVTGWIEVSNYSDTTLRNRINVLNLIFKKALSDGEAFFNPFEDFVKLVPNATPDRCAELAVESAIEPDVMRSMIREAEKIADTNILNARGYAVFCMRVFSFIEFREIAEAQVQDFRLVGDSYLFKVRSGPHKGRVLYLGARTGKALEGYLGFRGFLRPEDPLISAVSQQMADRNKSMSPKGLKTISGIFCKKLGKPSDGTRLVNGGLLLALEEGFDPLLLANLSRDKFRFLTTDLVRGYENRRLEGLWDDYGKSVSIEKPKAIGTVTAERLRSALDEVGDTDNLDVLIYRDGTVTLKPYARWRHE